MFVRQVGWLKASSWLGVGIVCLLCGCDRPAVAEEPSEAPDRPMRWAILGTPAIQDSGLSDLLHASLSSLEDVELVEREAFEAIASEYSLAELEAAGGVRDRLQLGTLLQADRLLLLSRAAVKDAADDGNDETNNDVAEVFRLVIADCQTGARIGQEYYPAETGPEDFVDAVTAAVGKTQSQFPDGVTQVVGVSHFLSKNLVHSYDHRQAGYAQLLQRSLALHPGTAVLEIEEARAIAQELSLGTPPDQADSLRRRTVPALVDGEFTVSEDHAAGTHAVDVTIRVRRGNGVEEIRATALPPDKVVSFLTGELARRILALDDEQTPLLSPKEQRDWLVARAEQFSRVGAWEHSLGLREAALLVDPHDVSLRLDTIHEYRLQMTKRLAVPETARQLPSEEKIREAYRARVGSYVTRLAHFEFLIRNRQLSGEEIFFARGSRRSRWSFTSFLTKYLELCIPTKFPYKPSSPREAREAEVLYRKLAGEEFRTAKESEAAFMDAVFPLIPKLECADCDRIQWRWAEELLKYHMRTAGRDFASDESLDTFYHIMTEAFPRNSGLSRTAMRGIAYISSFAARAHQAQGEHGERSRDDADRDAVVVEFFNRLAQDEQPVAQICGRFGLIHRRWLLWQELWRKEYSDFLPEAKELGVPSGAATRYAQAERSELPAELESLAEEARQLLAFYESLDMSGNTLVRGLPRDMEAKLASFTPASVPVRGGNPWRHYKPGEEDRLARFEFTGPVEMVVETLTGESRPVTDDGWKTLGARWGSAYRWSKMAKVYPIVGWRKCTESLDVLWNECAVLIMREKGVAEEIFAEPGPRFNNVKWDGRHLWIVTKHDGLRVISLTGEPIHSIGSDEGLPPYDQGVVFHPIERGVVCIAGSFGEQQRGWCAVVDWRSDQPVRVIHEATAVRSHMANTSEIDPADWVFTPAYIHEHADEAAQQRSLMIGRRSGGILQAPLIINLDTLKVTAFPHHTVVMQAPAPPREADFLHYSNKGRILWATGPFKGPGVRELTGRSLFDPDSLSRRGLCERGGSCSKLLPLGQWVYVPDERWYWYRIHRDTFEEQPVLRKPSASRINTREFKIFRISAHYGILVTHSYDGLHYLPYRQILIHEPS